MKWHRGAILLGALAALLASPMQAKASGVLREFYATTTSGTVTLNNYTKGDTVAFITDGIPIKNATYVMVWVASRYASPTGADSIYSDSCQVVLQASMDDTTWATISAASPKFGIIPNTTGLASTTKLSRTLNEDGAYIILAPHTPTGGTAAARGVIPARFRMIFTPQNRSTLAGVNMTAGKRTVGLKGLTVRVYAYYDNP